MTDNAENPYQSPKVVEADEPAELQADVRQGRRIFLAITASVATIQSLILWVEINRFTVILAIFNAGLFFAMWIGQQWAIAIGALCFVLAALSSIVAGLATGSLVGFAICTVFAFLFAGTFWLFVTNESLNAFFRYQDTIGRSSSDDAESEDEPQQRPDASGMLE